MYRTKKKTTYVVLLLFERPSLKTKRVIIQIIQQYVYIIRFKKKLTTD